jgi:transcriptional regulator with XRE-family HTH domain
MMLTDEAVSILAPGEMREARRLAGWSLLTLARYSAISITQLSEYENCRNGLTVDQVVLCKEILLGGVLQQGELIQDFIGRQREKAALLAAPMHSLAEGNTHVAGPDK